VRSWLSSQGLTVGNTTGDGLDVPASGPASTVEQVFGTSIVRYRLASGREVRANTSPPQVPVSVAPAVAAVLGLDNLQKPHHDQAPGQAKVSRFPLPNPAPAAPGAPSACVAAAHTPGNTASDMAALFDLNPLYQAGDFGQGVKVALFELANYPKSTIATYDQCYGITTAVTTVLVDGGTAPRQPTTTSRATPYVTYFTPTLTTASREVILDIETVAALAPKATVLDYEGNGLSGGFSTFFDVYSTMVQQDQAQVISTSWGYSDCEYGMIDGGTNLSLVEAPLFQAMAAQGQSMLSASGDVGSEGCAATVGRTGANLGKAPTPYVLSTEDPSDQPFVTTVGGTDISPRATNPAAQSVWNLTGPSNTGTGFTSPFDGATGRPTGFPGNWADTGGMSMFFAQPSWQAGFNTGNGSGEPCGFPTSTTGAPELCRETPDVSGVAWGTVGYYGRNWTETGGTSAASPQWAGYLALVDEQVGGGRIGLVSPDLYAVDRSDPSAFTDIVHGQNNYLSATSQLPAGTNGNRTCTYPVT